MAKTLPESSPVNLGDSSKTGLLRLSPGVSTLSSYTVVGHCAFTLRWLLCVIPTVNVLYTGSLELPLVRKLGSKLNDPPEEPVTEATVPSNVVSKSPALDSNLTSA